MKMGIVGTVIKIVLWVAAVIVGVRLMTPLSEFVEILFEG